MIPRFITPILIFIGFLAFSGGIAAQDIVISEIMFNPAGDENTDEYVELLNRSGTPCSLEGFLIGDGTGFDLIVPAGDGDWTVDPGGYAIILDSGYFGGSASYDIPPEVSLFVVTDAAIGSRGLSNSVPETVSLISAVGNTLSQVTYRLDCPAGHSWERVLPEGEDDCGNFMPSRFPGGTPGRDNSVLPPPHDPAFDDSSLTFSPHEPSFGEPLVISLAYRNLGREPVSSVSVTVTFESGEDIGILTFSETVFPGSLSSRRLLTIDRVPGGLVTMRAVITTGNTTLTGNDTLLISLSVPVPDGTMVINEVMAAPLDDEPEWIELANTGGVPVALAGWRVSDESAKTSDLFVTATLIPGNGFAVVAAGDLSVPVPAGVPVVTVGSLPGMNNDCDILRLHDPFGAAADSMRYEDALDGMSFELISPDMRGTGRGWDLSVDPAGATPGRENSIRYPPSSIDGENETASIRLTVDPNPFGDATAISYILPFPLGRIRLYVYDRRGRLVARIRDTEESGPSWTGMWDGRGDGGRLPAGPYILNLEVLDKQSGRVHMERAVVVIGPG